MLYEYLAECVEKLELFRVVYDDTEWIKNLAAKFAKFDKILLLGIGGASLGSKALVTFADSSKIIYFENCDARHFKKLMTQLNPQTTGLLVISKSGQTTETLMSLLTLNEMWHNFDFKNQALAITSRKSDLCSLAEKWQMPIVDHPNIGGRFSVFSVVGLLPAAIAGVDIDRFLTDARAAMQNLAAMPAQITELYKHFSSGAIKLHVLFCYSDFLCDFGRWFVQLVSESLGQAQHSGITPISAIGATDQHSLLQLFLAGPRDKFYTFVTRHNAPETPAVNTQISNLNGLDMASLMNLHQNATIDSLRDIAPVRVVNFGNSLGELMMTQIIETLGLAKLFNINPFIQPAVESSKHKLCLRPTPVEAPAVRGHGGV